MHQTLKSIAVAALATAFWISQPALAIDNGSGDELAECVTNTWKGTIGSHEVTMLFDPPESGALPVGYYYYGTSPHDLVLVQDAGRPNRWKEMDAANQITGYLELSCADRRLTGTWSDPTGKSVLPLRAESTLEPYAKRRAAVVRPTISGPFKLGHFQYEVLRAPHYKEVKGSDEIKTVRLLGDGAGVDQINAALREQFDEALQESIACSSAGRISRGVNHDYAHASEQHILDWNDRFVVIAESAWGYCGGPHPYSGSGAKAYRVATGERESLQEWLGHEYDSEISPTSPLGALLIERYKNGGSAVGQACFESVRFSSSDVWPTAKGMIFQAVFPYALTACISEISVPYTALAPYLSKIGLENARAFQTSPR